MELLSVLEKKFALLVEMKKKDEQRICELMELVEQHKGEVAALEESLRVERELFSAEKAQLSAHVEKLEDSLLSRHQSIEQLNQERELTKLAVDDLIKSIETLVSHENEHQE